VHVSCPIKLKAPAHIDWQKSSALPNSAEHEQQTPRREPWRAGVRGQLRGLRECEDLLVGVHVQQESGTATRKRNG